MIFRAGIFVVALVSTIRVLQINVNRSRKPRTSRDNKNEKASCKQEQIEKNGEFEESHVKPREKKENQAKTCKFESVDQLESSVQDKKGQYACEIDLLNTVVKEREENRGNLEVRLIESYCLKEQQSKIVLLQKELMDKILEVEMLRGTIHKLQAEKEKLCEEVKLNQLAEQQLESAKVTILEMQAKRDVDAEQMERQLVMLKERVLVLCMNGEYKGNIKVDKKLKAMKDVELKVLEMKRKHLELQLEKRELVVKLNAAKAKIEELSCMTEHEIVAKFQEEIIRLKHTNNNLAQEVDKLHKNRFSIIEELVYQRWLNKCLRFELEDYRSPDPKKIKPIVCRKLNFRSDSNSSEMSSIDSDDFSNSTTTSPFSSDNAKKKRHSMIHNIKRWVKGKDKLNANASETRNPQSNPGHIRRFSTSSIPSSISGLRSTGDSGVFFSSQNNEALESNFPENPAIRRVRRVSFNDCINSIRYIDDDDSPIRRVRRVSFNDSINSIRYIDEDSPESGQGTSDNAHKITESSSDCSGLKTSSGSGAILETKKAHDMPSSTAKGGLKTSTGSGAILERKKAHDMPSSTAKGGGIVKKKKADEIPSLVVKVESHDEGPMELNNQDLGTGTLAACRKEILSSGTPETASGASKFCDQMLNFILGVLMLVFFLVLVYFRLVSAFKVCL